MGHREFYVSSGGGQVKFLPKQPSLLLMLATTVHGSLYATDGQWQMFTYRSDTHSPTKINLFWQGDEKLFFFFSLT